MKTFVVPARQRLVTKQQKTSLVLVTLITGAAIGYILGSSTHSSTSAHLLHVQAPAIEVDPNLEKQKTTISKFAYVFYATRAEYYCAALVNAYQLIKLGKDPDIDILFITSTDFSPPPHQAAIAESMEIKHISVETLPLGKFDIASGEYQGYYKDSMVKLSVFSLYKQGYTRIVFLDSDSLVLKNLDELFYLPSVSIAAPRAYWIDPGTLEPNCSGAMMGRKDGPDVGLQQKFTSALMIVEPSAEIWNRLLSKYWPGGKVANFSNMFDMDLLNIEFKDEVMLLPATQIFRLTSDWGPDGRIANRNKPGNEEKLDQKVFDSTYVLHMTWGGKIWSVSPEIIDQGNPGKHPFALEIWKKWWRIAGVDGILKCAELGVGGIAPIIIPADGGGTTFIFNQ